MEKMNRRTFLGAAAAGAFTLGALGTRAAGAHHDGSRWRIPLMIRGWTAVWMARHCRAESVP